MILIRSSTTVKFIAATNLWGSSLRQSGSKPAVSRILPSVCRIMQSSSQSCISQLFFGPECALGSHRRQNPVCGGCHHSNYSNRTSLTWERRMSIMEQLVSPNSHPSLTQQCRAAERSHLALGLGLSSYPTHHPNPPVFRERGRQWIS